jgi:hypothetical protein
MSEEEEEPPHSIAADAAASVTSVPDSLHNPQSLQVQFFAAIDALDLQRAREVQQKIDQLQSEDVDDQLNEFRQDLDRHLDVTANDHRRHRSRLLKSLHRRELAERRAIDSALESTRSRQLAQLAALHGTLFEEFRTELEKPIPRYNELIDKVRIYGSRCDFERAQQNQDEAQDIFNAETARRKELFDRSYKAQITACLRQQEADLDALERGGKDAVAAIEKEREITLAREHASFRRNLARKYKLMADQIATLGRDRGFAAECLSAIDEVYGSALQRYGFVQAEDPQRPPLTARASRGETALSLRMDPRRTRPASKDGTRTRSGARSRE